VENGEEWIGSKYIIYMYENVILEPFILYNYTTKNSNTKGMLYASLNTHYIIVIYRCSCCSMPCCGAM
jgi:hypothetical protein